MQQLAEEASRLALETARAKGVETPAAEQAREFAEQALKAAEEANSGLLPDAAEAAEAASEAAQRTNRELHDPTDPAPPQLGEKSEELAQRQQNLAEELRQRAESPRLGSRPRHAIRQRMTEQTQTLAQQLTGDRRTTAGRTAQRAGSGRKCEHRSKADGTGISPDAAGPATVRGRDNQKMLHHMQRRLQKPCGRLRTATR
ncbi:MAG: hypothetical protein R3B91_14675 [Planctomycetaceae bacterium]